MSIEHLKTSSGRTVLYGDFEGMTDQDEILKQGMRLAQELKNSSGPQYFLVNFKGATVGTAFMTAIKNEAKLILKTIPLTTAVLGIDGLKQILIQGYIRFTGSNLRMFKTKEEAIGYLDTAQLSTVRK